jgi:L-histidine N-alpha-methyltransferase
MSEPRRAAELNSVAGVAIHSSQFPENVRCDLVESLRSRQVNHKFHYDTIKQAQKWLALHEGYSPARTDPDCAATYDHSFGAIGGHIAAKQVELISLGCGGGQKDARLLKLLHTAGKELRYMPCDASVPMVLIARQAALEVVPSTHCFPFVCDLATAEDLPWVFHQLPGVALTGSGVTRLLAFFGMLPNFEPQRIFPLLGSLVRPGDFLVFSANLAPGPDYAAGVKHILPLYDNRLTREWLILFLLDLGVDRADGEFRFLIEDDPAGTGLKRVAAYFNFARPRVVQIDAEMFEFHPGETIRLFFSYRHTPGQVHKLLAKQGLKVLENWNSTSGEEGVFLVVRS